VFAGSLADGRAGRRRSVQQSWWLRLVPETCYRESRTKVASEAPMKNENLISRRKIAIEWGDCDPAQIVYFPRYFEYFDGCTTALFKKAGLRKDRMLKTYGILGIPLVDVRASFMAPSRLSEVVTVESEIMQWGRSSFVVRHRLFKSQSLFKQKNKNRLGKQILAVECLETRVWAVVSASDPEKIESQPVPREVREKFSAGNRPRLS
jgi:4-hydroxybenzoyl-CoA thioesterase